MLLDPDRLPTDERVCAWMLVQLRWPDGAVCRRCGHRGMAILRCRPRVLACHACGAQRSVTAGTPLHGCRLSLRRILQAAALVARPDSISARALGRALRIDKDSAWRLAHRLRVGHDRGPSPLIPPLLPFPAALPVRSEGPFRWLHVAGGSLPALFLFDGSCRLRVSVYGTTAHAARTWADEHRLTLLPTTDVLQNRILDHVQHTLGSTHHQVTGRWIERYVHAFAVWSNARIDGAAADLATLQHTLARRGTGWSAIPPSRLPEIWR